jgi:hypothetical protein
MLLRPRSSWFTANSDLISDLGRIQSIMVVEWARVPEKKNCHAFYLDNADIFACQNSTCHGLSPVILLDLSMTLSSFRRRFVSQCAIVPSSGAWGLSETIIRWREERTVFSDFRSVISQEITCMSRYFPKWTRSQTIQKNERRNMKVKDDN